MYNPEGDDNNKEFVEIYSDEIINLSNFIIADSNSNDTLTLLQSYNSNYYLITEEGFNFSNIEANIYSAGPTIGNNLNKEDSLFLYYNDTLIHSVSYTDICESGHSLEYFNGNFYCSFYPGGTPGKENSNRNQSYSKIIINEFFPDPEGDDDAPMPNGEFIELYNDGYVSVDLAGSYLKDSANHKIYITDTTTIDGTIIEAKGYLAVYMNGFSGFLNNQDFEEIMLYNPNGSLIDKVNYAHSIEALSLSLVDSIWQHRLPSPNKINPQDNVEMESSFNIEKLEDVGSDNEAKFGDTIKVKFNVYKGDTTKSSIKLYIEKKEERITKITKATLHDKFTDYTLTLPIQIKPNCNKKYDDGTYYIKIGWTASSEPEDSFKIKVKGINTDNCDEVYVEKKTKKSALEYRLAESPAAIELDESFTLKVELTNNDDQDHLIDLYSYVYRGPKSYSGERDLNKKRVLIKADQTEQFKLENIVKEAEPGDYKLKIKIRREDQKTEKEITQPIIVFQGKGEEKEEKIVLGEKDKEDYSTILQSTKQPEVIYESTSIKAKNLAVYFLIGLLVVYAAILTWKR